MPELTRENLSHVRGWLRTVWKLGPGAERSGRRWNILTCRQSEAVVVGIGLAESALPASPSSQQRQGCAQHPGDPARMSCYNVSVHAGGASSERGGVRSAASLVRVGPHGRHRLPQGGAGALRGRGVQ
eukprot:3394720-Pyramimonas_sp.AAC.1